MLASSISSIVGWTKVGINAYYNSDFKNDELKEFLDETKQIIFKYIIIPIDRKNLEQKSNIILEKMLIHFKFFIKYKYFHRI